MKERTILAIFLSIAIMVLWSLYVQRFTKSQKEQLNNIQTGKATITNYTEQQNSGQNITTQQTTDNSSSIIAIYSNQSTEAQNFILENTHLKIIISSLNGEMKHVYLKEHNLKINSEKLVDLEEGSFPGTKCSTLFFDDLTYFRPSFFQYQLASKNTNSITLIAKIDKFILEKTFQINNEYKVTVTVRIINTSDDNNNFTYHMLLGSDIGPQKTDTYSQRYYTTTYSYYDGDKNRELLKKGIFKKPKNIVTMTNSEWMAIDNRYFMKVAIPDKKSIMGTVKTIQENGKEKKLSAYTVKHTIKGKQDKETVFNFYFMPKNRKYLNNKKTENFAAIFRHMAIIKILADPLYYVMQWINKIFNNYGITIIIITILFKLLTFPFYQSSFKSMRKMQELGPKQEIIREQYKKDPQKMNAEIMKLYKKEGVNPLSGCLPMFIPFPVLIAFYRLFHSMVELRGQSFLWIKDLAEPDTIAKLKITLPLIGNNINVLPLIMVVSSFVQTKMTPQPASASQSAQQQKMMSYLFPIMIFFFFWNMPSALVLYWTLQNLFTIFQNLIMKKNKS